MVNSTHTHQFVEDLLPMLNACWYILLETMVEEDIMLKANNQNRPVGAFYSNQFTKQIDLENYFNPGS